MKLFEWKGTTPNHGVALEPETKHRTLTHAVLIRCGEEGRLEVTYFTGRGPVKATVNDVPAVIIVADPERLRFGQEPRSTPPPG